MSGSKFGLLLAVSACAIIAALALKYQDARRVAPESQSPQVAQQPVEQMLARLDGKSTDEMAVRRFRFLAEVLSEKYAQSASLVGDMSYVAQRDIRKSGVEVSILEIMEGMNRVVARKRADKYSEVIACYMVMRQQGISHDDAIEALRVLLLDRTSTELMQYLLARSK